LAAQRDVSADKRYVWTAWHGLRQGGASCLACWRRGCHAQTFPRSVLNALSAWRWYEQAHEICSAAHHRRSPIALPTFCHGRTRVLLSRGLLAGGDANFMCTRSAPPHLPPSRAIAHEQRSRNWRFSRLYLLRAYTVPPPLSLTFARHFARLHASPPARVGADGA